MPVKIILVLKILVFTNFSNSWKEQFDFHKHKNANDY